METCVNHPDVATPYRCMKHEIHLCEACLRCRDPSLYCKHRSSCIIWFMEKREAPLPTGETVSSEIGK